MADKKTWEGFVTQMNKTQKLRDRAIDRFKEDITEAGLEMFPLVLDRYERDNLLALLHIVYQVHGLSERGLYLNTGDWCGQIYWRLAERGYDPAVHRPNLPPDKQVIPHAAYEYMKRLCDATVTYCKDSQYSEEFETAVEEYRRYLNGR